MAKLTRAKLTRIVRERIARHDTLHKAHQAARKKMFDAQHKARDDLHAKHQAARRKFLAEMNGDALHDHKRSPQ